MTFALFGFDFFKQDLLFGFWFLSFKNNEWVTPCRAFFVIYYDEGYWTFQLFWIDWEDVCWFIFKIKTFLIKGK